MSVYTNWHDGRRPGAPFNVPSPNLRAILDYMKGRWDGLADLGCYGVRPIRGRAGVWSAHSFGAAQDIGYRNGPSRDVIVSEVIPWLEEHAQLLGIQRIHDYMAKRYWQAGKGWIMRPPGDGFDWLHIETREDSWGWNTPIEERLSGTTTATPKPTKKASKSSAKPSTTRDKLELGSGGSTVEELQTILARLGYQNSAGTRPIVVDGVFGATTDRRVREFQEQHGLVVDGIVGPKTWGALLKA